MPPVFRWTAALEPKVQVPGNETWQTQVIHKNWYSQSTSDFPMEGAEIVVFVFDVVDGPSPPFFKISYLAGEPVVKKEIWLASHTYQTHGTTYWF